MPWEQPCLQASIVETSGYLLGPCALASSARWGMALLTPSPDPTPHLRSLLTLDSSYHTAVFGAS
ncbi:unnamed protein product [Fusarium graminearum]|nr:unnamed protein product [Fusarium graminearum]